MKSPTDPGRPARAMWAHTGQARPPFAVPPQPGQESVWDYPRPPRIVADAREVVVRAGRIEIARTRSALRVLETASPPTFYLPWAHVRRECFEAAAGSSSCEWKGEARYWSIVTPDGRIERAAWSYPEPVAAFEAIGACVSFYPSRLACFVDGVRVAAQPGGFYGGWVTPEVVGPFKGEPGTQGW